ncbi:MAG: CpsD/CapB family tyrosine-protein kinase [Lachnospiraceae bacterium]|nr:CpsD/CapB family tyrosine-protein kinase [Lachnospiraceae bacterium]
MSENETIKSTPAGAESSIFSNLDYYTLLKDLLKNWWVILLTGITVVLFVNTYVYLPYAGYKPMYTSSSTVMVKGTARSGSSYSYYSGNAEAFANILTDEYILQEVAEDMGLKKLDVEVTADIVAETNLISLSVRSDKPSTSYRVLKGLMEHYPDISEMMCPGYVLEELIAPEYPSGPDNTYDISGRSKKYALLAMAAMAALILLISWFYDSVKNERDVENKLDTRLYAAIYHERKNKTIRMMLSPRKRKNKKALLITSPVASFGFVESYRRMREKIITRCSRSGKKVILVTSMLENEGKSTVAANLALALAGVSDKVLLLDADLRKPAQYKIFGRGEEEERSFSEYLLGKAALRECLVRDAESGVYMICDRNHHSDSSEIIEHGRMKELIRTMREEMDYIIIDTPPVNMAADAETLLQYADYSLLVINPDHAPTQAVNDCIDLMRDGHARLLGCILNNIYTLPLVIQQYTGINVAGIAGGNYSGRGGYGSSYGYSYGYGRGYGYGSKEGVGQKSSEKPKKKRETYRESSSGEDFFAERVDEITEQED